MEAKRKRTEPTPPLAATTSSAAAMVAVFGSGDLLREILQRLNSPTCLARSAVVSKRWLRHASEPSLIRRFRARHPPRLLGFYLAMSGNPHFRFVPMPHPPELAASVRGGSLELGDRFIGELSDCRNDRLVAHVSNPWTYAVCHPLHPARGITAFPRPPIRLDDPGFFQSHQLLLLEDGGDGMSCISVTLMSNENNRRVWVHLQTIRIETGSWGEIITSNPVELPEPLLGNVPFLKRKFGSLANGKLYLQCTSRYILGLDLASTSLFYVKLPEGAKFAYDANIALSSAEGPGFYLIHVKSFEISVWLYIMDSNYTGNWNLVDAICLRQKFGYISGSIWDSWDDVIYVAAAGDNAEYVLLLVKTEIFYMDICSRTVEKVCKLQLQNGLLYGLYPLMMVWPPTFPALTNEHDQDE